MLERRGGAFTPDIDIKDEKKSRVPGTSGPMSQNVEEWKKPKNQVKQSGHLKMDVDAAVGVPGNRYDALWNTMTTRRFSARNVMRVFTGGRANTLQEGWYPRKPKSSK